MACFNFLSFMAARREDFSTHRKVFHKVSICHTLTRYITRWAPKIWMYKLCCSEILLQCTSL